jgi:hypothetical protein
MEIKNSLYSLSNGNIAARNTKDPAILKTFETLKLLEKTDKAYIALGLKISTQVKMVSNPNPNPNIYCARF